MLSAPGLTTIQFQMLESKEKSMKIAKAGTKKVSIHGIAPQEQVRCKYNYVFLNNWLLKKLH